MSSERGEEWLLLQKQHEQYEFAALAVKLVAVACLALGAKALIAVLLLLWLQDAIVKTFQARLGARLLRIEASDGAAMQLHSEWLRTRPRGLGLLQEYAASACRPTVAFPYVALIVLTLVF